MLDLWTARMLHHGFLAAGSFHPMLAHEERHVDDFLAACDPVLGEMGRAIAADDIEERIGGPVKRSGFFRLA